MCHSVGLVKVKILIEVRKSYRNGSPDQMTFVLDIVLLNTQDADTDREDPINLPTRSQRIPSREININ